jgi:aminoglycoside 2''-phosphotransferase
MKKFEKIKQDIQVEFPEFTISTIDKIGEGENSLAFLINQNFIFRFPKREEVKEQLAKEIATLPQISPLLNLEVPHFHYVAKNLNFAGHKLIAGQPFSNKMYYSFGKTTQRSIQQSLVLFLSQLHAIDLSALSDSRLPIMNLEDEYTENFIDTQQLIFPHLPTKTRETISEIFTSYLKHPDSFKYKPTLVHNDFSTDHILADPAKKEISGIIDFGDMAIGDPNYDLMYLADQLGVEFIKGMSVFYPKPRKNLLQKILFFAVANKVQIILSALEDNDTDAVKEGYKNLEESVRKYMENSAAFTSA